MIDTADLETTIAGGLMVQPGLTEKVADILEDRDFSCKMQRQVFKEAIKSRENGNPFDLPTMGIKAASVGMNVTVLSSFIDDLPIVLPFHAEQLREAAARNRFQKRYDRIVALNASPAEKCKRFADLDGESGSTKGIDTGKAKPIKVITATDLLQMEFPPRENLLSPWLPKQGLCLLHAYRGVGKTHISLGVTCAVVTGSTFLQWKAGRPAGCLFIDGEMPAVVLQERIAQTIASMDGDGEATLNIITPDMQGDHGMPDLATLEGQQRLEPYITGDVELIVVDNISTLCRSSMENRGDTWLPMQEWALRMRARGKSVLLIHHDGKGGQQRGTSRKEDILDTVIQLKNPTDYTPDKGALFEVHFMKNRGIYGDDVKPFEAQLMDMGDGLLGWTTRSIEESTYEKVVALLNDGWSQVDIATELGIVKSAVHKHKKKAVGNGDFKP